MSDQPFQIAGREIGPGRPPYVVAEMSANHGGDFQRAAAVVEAAAAAGADAVKLQTYTPDTLTLDCPSPVFRVAGTPWAGRTLFELYRQAAMPWEWQPRLQRVANRLGLALFSTPFDPTSVDFLQRMDVPAYKIASFELVDLPLLRRVGETRKPVILSTGMATIEEIAEAVATLRRSGAAGVALLHCTSAYPAPADQMNLRRMERLAAEFGCPVGLSDHTLELAVPVAAVALGASILEKHLTVSRDEAGCDAAFSLEPNEFKEMVRSVRAAHAALGDACCGPSESETDARRLRRSLFVVEEIEAGEPFTVKNVRSIRPADGLPPKHLDEILGRRAARHLPRGTPLSWEHVE